MTYGTAVALIRFAYPTVSGDVRGGPAWIGSERFDVRAKSAGPTTQSTLQAMVRTMLAERFQLRAHYELVERPVFKLVVADGKPKPALKRTDLNCDEIRAARARGDLAAPTPGRPTCSSTFGGGSLTAIGVPMSTLARLISSDAGRFVIDATNLEGDFEFRLSWNPRPLSDQPVDRPTLFAALEQQLGLRLQPATAPVEIVVVDQIERPTPD
jgi:uncharacterized protein (TIGR03435 family)